MEPATSPKKVFICFPKENLRRFAEIYELVNIFLYTVPLKSNNYYKYNTTSNFVL